MFGLSLSFRSYLNFSPLGLFYLGSATEYAGYYLKSLTSSVEWLLAVSATMVEDTIIVDDIKIVPLTFSNNKPYFGNNQQPGTILTKPS